MKRLPSVDYVHDYGLDPEMREIYLFGREEYAHYEMDTEPGVEYTMANQFIKNLRILQSLGDDPILIHMKTNGGYWEEGMAIYQAILTCPVHCTILNYTHARSMSSIIFQAADNRVMMPFSTFMYHRGTTGFDGTITQLVTEFEQNKIAEAQMIKIYTDKMSSGAKFKDWTTRRRKTYLMREMKEHEEVYLNAEDTVDHGFADGVFGSNGTFDWAGLREANE